MCAGEQNWHRLCGLRMELLRCLATYGLASRIAYELRELHHYQFALQFNVKPCVFVARNSDFQELNKAV